MIWEEAVAEFVEVVVVEVELAVEVPAVCRPSAGVGNPAEGETLVAVGILHPAGTVEEPGRIADFDQIADFD